MAEVRYRPKGGMCATCKHVLTRDCRDLPFYRMQPIEREGDAVTVKCSEYERCANQSCTCEACAPRNQFGGPTMMPLCPECGDKRCPKAKHHDNTCTTPHHAR